MLNNAYIQYCKSRSESENDPEYASIFADFRAAEANYLALYREMTPQQQEVLTEFIGKLSELYQREIQLIITA